MLHYFFFSLKLPPLFVTASSSSQLRISAYSATPDAATLDGPIRQLGGVGLSLCIILVLTIPQQPQIRQHLRKQSLSAGYFPIYFCSADCSTSHQAIILRDQTSKASDR